MPPPHYGAAPCTLVYTKLRQIDRLTEHDVLRHVDVMRAEDHDASLEVSFTYKSQLHAQTIIVPITSTDARDNDAKLSLCCQTAGKFCYSCCRHDIRHGALSCAD